MGVDARLIVYASSEDQAQRACSAAFARIGELDRIMSDYKVDSELNQLCAAPAGKPVVVSRDLFRVLSRAQEFARLSGGAFDITAGPVIRLWRAARKAGIRPASESLALARSLVGYEKLHLDARRWTATLAVSGMKLDLGGIAKGYADDEAQRVLRKFGITRALVEMGGDIVVTGPPPGQAGWRITVPNSSVPGEMLFKHCAISSSGDTEQFTVIDGVQYSHVVDPRTGEALTNRVQSTVVTQFGLDSDPLSTALTVGSESERAALLVLFPRARVWTRSLARRSG